MPDEHVIGNMARPNQAETDLEGVVVVGVERDSAVQCVSVEGQHGGGGTQHSTQSST